MPMKRFYSNHYIVLTVNSIIEEYIQDIRINTLVMYMQA